MDTEKSPQYSQWKLTAITLTLVFGSVIVNSALDMHAPVLPDIRHFFNVDESLTQWTVSSYFLGTAIAALAYGPFADCYGRKKMLLIGMFIFLASSFFCTVAGNIEELIVARFFQGVGGVSSSVIWLTIIKDLYKGKKSVQILNIFSITISLSLSAAPIIGSVIASYFAWRGVFGLLTIMACVQLFLVYIVIPETLQTSRKRALSVVDSAHNYSKIFTNKSFLTFGLMNGLIHGLCVAQIPLLSIYFQEVLDLSRDHYAMYQLIPTLAYAFAAWWARKFVEKQTLRRTLNIGISIIALFVISMTGILLFCPYSAPAIVIASCIYNIGSPFVGTVVVTKGMEIFPNIGGTSSSALTSMRQLTASFITFMAGVIYCETYLSMMTVLSAFSIILILAYYSNRNEIND